VGTIGITITLALMPFARHKVVLFMVLAVMGLSMGAIDTTANVCMITVYGTDVTPFLQVLTFCANRQPDEFLIIMCGMLTGIALLLWPWRILRTNDCRTVSTQLRLFTLGK
jgi:hypothetical protein